MSAYARDQPKVTPGKQDITLSESNAYGESGGQAVRQPASVHTKEGKLGPLYPYFDPR